jgi:hypothetical protein
MSTKVSANVYVGHDELSVSADFDDPQGIIIELGRVGVTSDATIFVKREDVEALINDIHGRKRAECLDKSGLCQSPGHTRVTGDPPKGWPPRRTAPRARVRQSGAVGQLGERRRGRAAPPPSGHLF